METKKNKNILLIVGGVILVIIVAVLIYFANKPSHSSTTDTSSSSTSTSVSSSTAGEGTDIAGTQTTQAKLDKVSLPQLSTTVSSDEAEVQLQTTAGNINIKLFPKLAPNAVENFLALAKEGYYKDNEFFRVINDFMIQAGDPSNKGTGSKVVSSVNGGKSFDTEISDQLYNIRGALSLANTGAASSSSSQFFIVQSSQDMSSQLTNYLRPAKIADAYKKGGYPSLDGSYTVFGQVISGMDIVDKIASAKVTANSSGEESSPVSPVKITNVKIVKDWKF
ncbi:peptidylprolyl isomerase [Lactococcus sp.]|uniref:peptidylprolyl isomerase n=1 Tax=Lactococcus sp. TaxID=44273 RepID=UPI0035B28F26